MQPTQPAQPTEPTQPAQPTEPTQVQKRKNISFLDFDKTLSSKHIFKGRALFEDGKVTQIRPNNPTERPTTYIHQEMYSILVEVKKDSHYEIFVTIDQGKTGIWVIERNCDCGNDHPSDSACCIHIIAALYGLRKYRLPDFIPNQEETKSQTRKNQGFQPYSRQNSREPSPSAQSERRKPSDEEIQARSGRDTQKSRGRSSSKSKSQDSLKSKVEEELKCGICYEIMEGPIQMGCKIHFYCKACTERYLNSLNPGIDGSKRLYCPQCGKKAPALVVKKPEELKPNYLIANITQIVADHDEEEVKSEKTPTQLSVIKEFSSGASTRELKDHFGDLVRQLYDQDVDIMEMVRNIIQDYEEVIQFTEGIKIGRGQKKAK